MSQENLEIVRRGVEAYLRGDLVGAFAEAAPNLIWNPAEAAELHGHEEIGAYFAEWEDVWEDYEMEAENFRALGPRVVVTFRFRGKGKESGVPIDQRSFFVYTVRDGKIVRMDEYPDRSALAAAGLDE